MTDKGVIINEKNHLKYYDLPIKLKILDFISV